MRRVALDLAFLFALATVVVADVSLTQPNLRSGALHVYVLALGAIAMIGLVAATGDALPRRRHGDFERAIAARGGTDGRLPQLERLEREVTLATASAFDLHSKLLPQLREIAAARLERRGLTLAPEHAGSSWELLRPDREPPQDRHGGGISPDELRRLVAELERI